MSEPRWFSAAVYIPGEGVLVVGGSNSLKPKGLSLAELLTIKRNNSGDSAKWLERFTMLKPCGWPMATHLNRRVFITERTIFTHEIQVLDLRHKNRGQWSLIYCDTQFQDNFCLWSIGAFAGKLLLSGELTFLPACLIHTIVGSVTLSFIY